MKKVRVFSVLAFVAALLSPSVAHAAAIPLSHCETITGNLPPTSGSVSWSANGVCNDFIYPISGRTFFFQENQTAQNPKDHSIIISTELYVQDNSKNWIDLGKAPALAWSFGSNKTFSNFVETPQGLFLGGFFTEKDTGTCGTAVCKAVKQFETLKIDSSNHVTKFTSPSVAGSNKSPGMPFSSGSSSVIYFSQPQGLITTFGKKGVATTSGQIVKKGTAFTFYSLDLTSNKLSALPQLTSIAGELGIPAIASLGSSEVLFDPIANKIFQLSNSGKISMLAWEPNEIYQPIKDGIAATAHDANSITFHLGDGQTHTCSYSGGKAPVSADGANIIVDAESFNSSDASNTVSVPFYLGTVDQANSLEITPDCSYSFKFEGSSVSDTQNFVNEITHQVSSQAPKGKILRMFTPDGLVFDKVLGASYQAAGVSSQGNTGPHVTCTVDNSQVNKMASTVFFGTNYVEWTVNPATLGAKCTYPGAQKFKIVDEAFSISVHYIPAASVPTPSPSATTRNSVIQAAGVGDAKWPAKCPAVIDTVGGTQPKISGYKFDGSGGENYMRLVDGGSTAVTSPGNLLGCYADIPSLNGAQANAWHIGTINRDASGYYWQNAAGVRWGLTLSGTILVTDKSNPYYANGHQFITY